MTEFLVAMLWSVVEVLIVFTGAQVCGWSAWAAGALSAGAATKRGPGVQRAHCRSGMKDNVW